MIYRYCTYLIVSNLLGLSVRVSFTGTAALKSLHSLSGGQRAVVALLFIVALQVQPVADPAGVGWGRGGRSAPLGSAIGHNFALCTLFTIR